MEKRDAIAVSQRISHWLQLKEQGHSFNRQLLSLREFRSPRIEQRLIEYAGLEEVGSNLDRRDFDPKEPPAVDYEQLSLEQREAWEKETNHKSSNKREEQTSSITVEKSYLPNK